MIKAYFGDFLKLQKDIPDKSIDCIFADLPYGVTKHKHDTRLPFGLMWLCFNRVLKPNGNIILFAQGMFYVDLVASNRDMFRYDYCWDKVLPSGHLSSKHRPLRQHEQMAVFYESLGTYNPQFTEGKPLHSKGKNFVEKVGTNSNYGEHKQSGNDRAGSTQKYPTSILRYSKPHSSVAKHRTSKPSELIQYVIKTYTNEGDTILDPTMGSGIIGVEAEKLSRNYLGYEIDEETYKNSLIYELTHKKTM